jgi:hypothetical protein
MANSLFVHIAENTVIIWTDANPTDPDLSRRNIIEIGTQCIALHGDFVPWLPIVQKIVADAKLKSLPADQLATTLSQRLLRVSSPPQNGIGIIVTGFANGIPVIIGLHSLYKFVTTPYPLYIIAEMPTAIWAYLASILNIIPRTMDNVIDICLMGGAIHHKVLTNTLPGSIIVIVSPGQSPFWLPDADITSRQSHNNRRLQALQLNLIRQSREIP